MNNNKIFDILIAILFAMISQIGGIGSKDRYLVNSFCLTEDEQLPAFNLRDMQLKIEIYLLNDNTGHKKFHK